MNAPGAVAAVLLSTIAIAGNGSLGWTLDEGREQQSTAPTPKASAPAATAAAAPKMAPEVLDKLLAPIALYPDQLLAQVLLCAETPAKVQELSGWLIKNQELKGTELQDAAQKQGFEPSFVVLALFPQVVNFMADNIAWTKELGQAFSTDRQGVMASIQRLRAEAKKVGNLKTTPQQKVETKTTTGGEQVTVIEPANPQVVYVPQYNPQVVYTQPATTTVVIQEDNDSSGAAAAGAIVGFAAGIAIGAAMDNDYYYGPHGWSGAPRMYTDDRDDFYDDRRDAREDYYENREDAREDYYENRDDARENAQDRRENTTENRSERANTTQQQRTENQQNRQGTRTQTAQQSAGTASSTAQTRTTTRQSTAERSGTKSDAFSGYSSGRSERSASARGQSSRSRSGGGGRRR